MMTQQGVFMHNDRQYLQRAVELAEIYRNWQARHAAR